MQTDASIDFTVIGQRVTHFFPWRKRCECHYDDAFWPLAIKWTFCHSLLTLMSFQIRKTFVHLWNTNEDIFDEIQELSDPT